MYAFRFSYLKLPTESIIMFYLNSLDIILLLIFFSFRIRGALGSLLMVICCSGILLSFIAGSYLDYGTVPYVFIFLPLIFMIGFLFLPETPHNLLARNNFKVIKALILLITIIVTIFYKKMYLFILGSRGVVHFLQTWK